MDTNTLLILSESNQLFIKKHIDEDVRKLALRFSKDKNSALSLLMEQILAAQKVKTKIPSWYGLDNFIYPPSANLEQSSSEITALFKAAIVKEAGFDTFIDLTGGSGVDSLFIAKQVAHLYYVEPLKVLYDLVIHNSKILNQNNSTFYNMDAEKFLNSDSIPSASVCYLDPSRRNSDNRLRLLIDYQPNVQTTVQLAFQKNIENCLLKLSPMDDLKEIINYIPFVSSIYIVSVKNECKEILVLAKKNYKDDIKIVCADFNGKWSDFSYLYKEENQANVVLSFPLLYIYEPNLNILKAGAFKMFAKQFNLNKLHAHTHLYTSDLELVIPARRFKLRKIIKYDVKEIAKEIPDLKATISCRNFPDTVENIRKKTKLKDGGNLYLFFVTLMDNSHKILITEKV